jgi:hypothetical protein
MKTKTEDDGSIRKFDLNSRFWKSLLTIVAVALIFLGPTYITYALTVLNVAYLTSLIMGIVVFAIGIVLLIYLIKRKVIT